MHLATYDFYKESYLRATRTGQGGEGRDADQIAETVRSAQREAFATSVDRASTRSAR